MALKKALVTGASGFLGTRLCEALAKKGVKVNAFVQKNQATHCLPKNATEFAGDLLDVGSLATAAEGCDVVFHLGAQSTPKLSQQQPGLDLNANVQGTLNALEASQQSQAKKFIFTSTSFVYGKTNASNPLSTSTNHLKINENTACNPNGFYGMHKLLAEEYCRFYARTTQTRVVIARLFNAYGPSQRGRVIGDLIEKAKATQAGGSFQVLGNAADYRDFLFADDAVSALLVLAQKGENGEAYNVGSGKALEIKELAEKIAFNFSKNGMKISPNFEFFDKKTAYGAVADVSKLKRLGWTQKVSFDEGLKLCIESAQSK